MNDHPKSENLAFRNTFRRKVIAFFFPRTVSFLLKAICTTCHETVENQTVFYKTKHDHGKILLAFWHESLALALWYFRNSEYYTLTSLSFDGELAAKTVERFGMHAIRGSSTRGGLEALRQLLAAFQRTDVVGFTLDGPKGPRRVAKPGIAILARKTGYPIVPVAFQASPCIRIRSWDRMMFPLPFSSISVRFGDPVFSEKNKSIELIRYETENNLNILHERV